MRDRREQHEARRRLAVVLLRQRVRDPVVERLLERVEAGRAGVRLVVAEEREDDVGLGVGRRRTGSPRSRRSGCGAAPLSHSSGVPKFFERRRVAISSPLKPRLRKTSSCFGKRACSIVSSQPSYCIRSASVLPMMQMWSFGCELERRAAPAADRGHRPRQPPGPAPRLAAHCSNASCSWIVTLRLQLPTVGIGESHPARSEGFMPFTKPLKL